MRLLTHVVLELAALGAATVGVGAAVRRLAHRDLDPGQAQAVARGALADVDLPAPALSADDKEPPPFTFLGMADEILLDRLRQAPIVRIKVNRGGTSISLRFEFADGSRAAFKPNQTNPQSVPRKEVAAFRLDRVLGLGHVAPAVPRRLTRAELEEKLAEENRLSLPRILSETIFDETGTTAGEAQYFIPTIRDLELESPFEIEEWSAWLGANAPPPPRSRASLAQQISTLLVFDVLTNNSDRFTGGNFVGSLDSRFLYFMDNTFGFQADAGTNLRCRQALMHTERFSRSLVRALERLDAASIVAELRKEPNPPYEILTPQEIEAILKRRDVALAYIRNLVDRFGEQRVLYFP